MEKILEQLGSARIFNQSKNFRPFLHAKMVIEKREEFDLSKKCAYPSCSNISFPENITEQLAFA